MAGRIPPEIRYRIMHSIRGLNTAPEVLLSDAAKRAFPRARIIRNAADLPGRPDILIPALNLILFADGCLFHGCPTHCRVPRRNRSYWIPKIASNIARDKRVRRRLRAMGYSVWRIWEHECKDADMSRLERRLRVIGNRAELRCAQTPATAST